MGGINQIITWFMLWVVGIGSVVEIAGAYAINAVGQSMMIIQNFIGNVFGL